MDIDKIVAIEAMGIHLATALSLGYRHPICNYPVKDNMDLKEKKK